jgi:DNA repair protein RadC
MAKRGRNGLDERAGLFELPATKPETPHYHGHRARLKARFAEHGAEALPDYELLEMVLFNASPRADVKPLAKRLIAEFGDFNHVVSAPRTRLMAVEGVGEAAVHQLKLVEAAAQRLAKARVMRREVVSSWSALVSYCKTRMAHQDIETFRLLFLDRKNVLIADEEQMRGTIDAVSVHPREVVRRALDLGASAVIMVHNHPSGDPAPSQADITMTRKVRDALAAVDIRLHDHLIVGKDSDASLGQLGLL